MDLDADFLLSSAVRECLVIDLNEKGQYSPLWRAPLNSLNPWNAPRNAHGFRVEAVRGSRARQDSGEQGSCHPVLGKPAAFQHRSEPAGVWTTLSVDFPWGLGCKQAGMLVLSILKLTHCARQAAAAAERPQVANTHREGWLQAAASVLRTSCCLLPPPSAPDPSGSCTYRTWGVAASTTQSSGWSSTGWAEKANSILVAHAVLQSHHFSGPCLQKKAWQWISKLRKLTVTTAAV